MRQAQLVRALSPSSSLMMRAKPALNGKNDFAGLIGE